MAGPARIEYRNHNDMIFRLYVWFFVCRLFFRFYFYFSVADFDFLCIDLIFRKSFLTIFVYRFDFSFIDFDFSVVDIAPNLILVRYPSLLRSLNRYLPTIQPFLGTECCLEEAYPEILLYVLLQKNRWLKIVLRVHQQFSEACVSLTMVDRDGWRPLYPWYSTRKPDPERKMKV